MRIGICDDDKSFIEIIKGLLLKHTNKEDILIFPNDEHLIDNIIKENPDVLFLDIEMPERSGIEIGDQLAQAVPSLNIIFLTNKAELVFRALYCQPFRFIRKSHMEEELEEAIDSLKIKLSKENFIIEFIGRNETYKLRTVDIIYMESNKHYIYIHMKDREYRIRGKLSEYDKSLKDYGFFRIHLGFLVNVRFVYRITASEVELDDGSRLPVSKKYSTSAREEYGICMRRYVNGLNV